MNNGKEHEVHCDEAFEQLYQYLDKELEQVSMTEIEVHLKRCRGCWDYFEFERKLKARFKKCCCDEPLPSTLRDRIQALLKKY